jgi:hypothetical protein
MLYTPAVLLELVMRYFVLACALKPQLSSPPKLVEKLVWVPVISFSKISFPVKHLMPYYAELAVFDP